MQQSQQQVKEIMDIKEVSEQEIRSLNRDYNPAEWDKTINRFLKFTDTKFYMAEPQKGYSYPRYYAVYTIPEGIKLMNEVSYSSCLSNRGFCLVQFNNGKLYTKLLQDRSGTFGYCENTKENRRIMANNTKNFGVTYSTLF